MLRKLSLVFFVCTVILSACGSKDEPVAPNPADTTSQGQQQQSLLLAPPHDTVFEAGGVRFNMIYVPSGTFTMGASTTWGDVGYDPDADIMEQPPHAVHLDAFLIADLEVTQFLYFAVMGDNPSQQSDLVLPVHNVSYYRACQFIDSLNSLTGFCFRLPTEAEWEYAAKGGGMGGESYFSGSDTLDNVAWSYQNSDDRIHQSALLQPNALGLYDMSGNVLEWCTDWYGYYSSSPQDNPQGPEMPSNINLQKRVLRGGSFRQAPYYLRNTARQFAFGSREDDEVGLRLVISVRQ